MEIFEIHGSGSPTQISRCKHLNEHVWVKFQMNNGQLPRLLKVEIFVGHGVEHVDITSDFLANDVAKLKLLDICEAWYHETLHEREEGARQDRGMEAKEGA